MQYLTLIYNIMVIYFSQV